MRRHLIGPIIALFVFAIVLGGIEWLARKRWGNNPPKKRSARTLVTDVLWWLCTPTLTAAVATGTLIFVVVVTAFVLGFGKHQVGPEKAKHAVEAMFAYFKAASPISRLPSWVQLILAMVITDFVGYWVHVVFHRSKRLWRFHAVHHSSTKLDWLASTRVHPVNDAIGRIVVSSPLLFLGFSTGIFVGIAPTLAVYAVLIHADVPWSFGPLKYVFASPRFHRWHHTSEDQGLDKNFAGMFPIWDLLFGTFYMPEHEPTVFGVNDHVPDGIVKQLLWPFRPSAFAPAPVTERPQLAGAHALPLANTYSSPNSSVNTMSPTKAEPLTSGSATA